eukprot:g2618.t1
MQDLSMKSKISQESRVHLPKELSTVSSTCLEEYVSARIKESLTRLQESSLRGLEEAQLTPEAAHVMRRSWQKAINSEVGYLSPFEAKEEHSMPLYMLSFKHKCQAIGCTNTACDLCESNPKRGCTTDFGKKYFKGDVLKAKCGGSICVELLNKETMKKASLDEFAPDTVMELCVVDGNRFDQLFPQQKLTSELTSELESCMLLYGNGDRPLLRSEDKALNRENGVVSLPVKSAEASLCDLTVQCSSEALLSGRRPPFRLLARLSSSSDPSVSALVSPALSTSFIVASGRSRLSQKKSIPFLDDPVSRLENMGKERIKKLRDLNSAARVMNVDLPSLTCWEVITVADFQRLAFEVDTDGQVKQKLLHMLKMSEKAWEETRDHAASAITNDTRMRAWYRPNVDETQGLAYVCYLGEMEMERPVALLLGSKIVLKEGLDPNQRTLMKELQELAVESWWKPNHPNWTFFDFDSEVYKKDHRSLLTYGNLEPKNSMERTLTPRSSVVKKQHLDAVPVEDASGLEHRISSCQSSGSYRHRKKQRKDISGNAFIRDTQPELNMCEPRGYGVEDTGTGLMRTSTPVHPARFTGTDFSRHDGQPAELGRNTLETRTGPIIPRPPPDSGFRGGFVPAEFKPRETRREDVDRREAFPRPIGVEGPDLLRRFLVSPNTEPVEGSSSGTGDNYNPPQQPAAAVEHLRHLLQGRTGGLQSENKRDERVSSMNPNPNPSPDMSSGNYEVLSCLEKLLVQPGLTPLRDSLMQAVLSQRQGSTNGLQCSIESLPSDCKAVMSEEERIRQVANNLSNQDLQQSFEAGMLDHMKQRVSGSPKAITEDNDNRQQIHTQEQTRLQVSNEQQNHVLTSEHHAAVPFFGGMHKGYILVPLQSGSRNSNDDRKEAN